MILQENIQQYSAQMTARIISILSHFHPAYNMRFQCASGTCASGHVFPDRVLPGHVLQGRVLPAHVFPGRVLPGDKIIKV